MNFKYFDPYVATRVTRNRLPHWEQDGALYFITFHLADSIPLEARERIKAQRDAWLAAHPKPWTDEVEHECRKQHLVELETWLDKGCGACPLRAPECAEIVAAAIRHFDGQRLDVMSFVVMPNHVHLAIVPHPGWSLENLTQSWKIWTARRINPVINASGTLWQKDYFDTIVRDQDHHRRVLRYIRNNPAKANLGHGKYVLYESDYATRFL